MLVWLTALIWLSSMSKTAAYACSEEKGKGFMTIRRSATCVLCALLAGPVVGQGVPSEPEGVVAAWAAAFNECSAEKLAALYDPTATLWGTNSPALASTPEAIRSYFDRACGASPPIRVAVGQVVSRVYANFAAVAGTYQFSREGVPLPSRYSFAMVNTANGWRIVQHHSSPLPARP